MITGWPSGLPQDDSRGLSKWLANRPGARRIVRDNLQGHLMGTININGHTYFGNNITIRGGVVAIDGKRQDDSSAKGAVEIRVLSGDLTHLDTDLAVSCGNVLGGVNAGGSVSCDDVAGNVVAGGSVSCDDVGGSVTAGGSVSRS